jgi:hypothetical protein
MIKGSSFLPLHRLHHAVRVAEPQYIEGTLMRQTYVNLCALALIVVATVVLIALGLPSEQIIAVSTAVGVLYSAWHQANSRASARDEAGTDADDGQCNPPSREQV